ncbi:unnamed protein product [Paramecium octaurelia]|uniref:Transmembrane protein n=1 Tax=Paramecium octaurelia TaxID=43137 RepID=A0A8S1W8G7_PAROT|nr:unnamed protein product [Paramecium octaurelia]
MQCRGETFDNFIHQEQTLDEILNKQKHLMTISKIYFIIISVLSSLIIICKSNCCKQRKMIQTYGLMKIVLISLQLYFITLSFEKTKQEKNFLEDIISKNCSDDYVQQQLEYLRDMLTEQIYKYNLIYMILVCIVLGIDYCLIIFYFVWKKFLKRNQYNN